jgi:hypothetical protein
VLDEVDAVSVVEQNVDDLADDVAQAGVGFKFIQLKKNVIGDVDIVVVAVLEREDALGVLNQDIGIDDIVFSCAFHKVTALEQIRG